MARPSLAATRRAQILDALERCLARDGLERTSLASVAAEAGVARPLIRHYFGNRDALLAAAVERALEAYGADLEAALRAQPRGKDTLDAFLDHLFLGRFVGNVERDRIFHTLFAAAGDPGSRRLLRDTYRRFEDVCAAALRAAAPDAPAATRRGTAYAIACLAEQNAGFLAIGFPRSRARAARDAAAVLARRLTEGPHA